MPRDVMRGRSAMEFDEVFAVLELEAEDKANEDDAVDTKGRPDGPPPDAPKGIDGLTA